MVARLAAEVDGGGAGEAGAGDRHAGPARRGPAVGVTPVTVGRGGVGELVGGAGGAVPAGRGDGHVDGAGAPAGAVAVIEVALLTVKRRRRCRRS